MGQIIRNGIGYGGGGGYTKKEINDRLEPIETATNGISESKANYIELKNGLRLYISSTEPTDTDIPDGSIGVGWSDGVYKMVNGNWTQETT